MNQHDDEQKFKLTEQGEARAVELQGGQDILNTANACLLLLEQEWNKEIASQFSATLGAQAAMKTIRQYLQQAHPDAWEGFVRWAEEGLGKARPDYFQSFPHASKEAGL